MDKIRTRNPAQRRTPTDLRAEGHLDGSFGSLAYHGGTPRERGLLAVFFEHVETIEKRTLLRELDRRGYDLRTLRFSIRRKKASRRHPG